MSPLLLAVVGYPDLGVEIALPQADASRGHLDQFVLGDEFEHWSSDIGRGGRRITVWSEVELRMFGSFASLTMFTFVSMSVNNGSGPRQSGSGGNATEAGWEKVKSDVKASENELKSSFDVARRGLSDRKFEEATLFLIDLPVMKAVPGIIQADLCTPQISFADSSNS